MVNNQIYWEQADWSKLANFINNPSDFPDGIDIDHHYFEDIRKRLWLLDHIGASTYDPEAYEWITPSEPVGQYNLRVYPGMEIVTTVDDKYGWLWWTLASDVSKYTHWKALGPTTDIHPDDNPDGDGNNTWQIISGIWALMPDPNKYHQWDKNKGALKAPAVQFYGSQNLDTYNLCNPYIAGHRWYPKQVDPKEQYDILFYKDTQKKGHQFKKKVNIDRKFITQPDTLGAIFTSFRWGDNGTTSSSVNKDPYLLKKIGGFLGNQYANRDAGIERFGLGANSPGQGPAYKEYYPAGGKRYTGREPSSGGAFHAISGGYNVEWSFNPKRNYAYQNAVEITLNGRLYYPASGRYRSNFKDKWNVSDEKTSINFYSFPQVNDELWGENASGFELFLSFLSTGNDWYFDALGDGFERFGHTVFYPPFLVDWMTQRVLTAGELWSNAFVNYDLTLAGTWRRTWKNSMGRVSSFMRSYEMGEPSRTDDWNPLWDVGTGKYWNKAADGKGDWYGSRSKEYPKITEFDNKNEPILEHIDDYEFVIAIGRSIPADVLDILKIGYLVHFVDLLEQKIHNGTNFVRSGYVTKITFVAGSSGKPGSIVVRTTHNSKNDKIITWNPKVSERHDPIAIDFGKKISSPIFTLVNNVPVAIKKGADFYRILPSYELHPELIKEIHEILKIKMFRDIDVQQTTESLVLGGGGGFGYGEDWDSQELVQAKAWQEFLDEIDFRSIVLDDPDTWDNTGFGLIHQWQSVRVEESIGNEPLIPDGWHWVMADYQLSKYAVMLSAGEEAIAALHGTALLRIRFQHAYANEACPPVGIPANIGIGDFDITIPVDNTRYYYEVPMEIIKTGAANIWMIIEINDGWTFNGLWCFDPAPDRHTFTQANDVNISITTQLVKVGLDWERVPESVFKRNDLLHIDIDKQPVLDIDPPNPDPSVWHINPQAYFIYIPESGTVGFPDFVPEHFELYVKGDSVLADDSAGNDPVKYHMVEQITGLDSFYNADRQNFIKIRDMTIGEALGGTWNLDTVATSNPIDDITRFEWANAEVVTVGDVIELNGTPVSDGIWTITNASSTWFEIDKGYYASGIVLVGATIKVLSGYNLDDWNVEPAKDYLFGIQSKDSKIPVPNEGEFSTFLNPDDPTIFPEEIYSAL